MKIEELKEINFKIEIDTKFFDWYKEEKMKYWRDNLTNSGAAIGMVLTLLFVISIIHKNMLLFWVMWIVSAIVVVICIILYQYYTIYCFKIDINPKDFEGYLEQWKVIYSISTDDIVKWLENKNKEVKK